jgi:hypothetical protein
MEVLRKEASSMTDGPLSAVISAKAGIQLRGKLFRMLDPRFRGDDSRSRDDSRSGDDGVGRGFLAGTGG